MDGWMDDGWMHRWMDGGCGWMDDGWWVWMDGGWMWMMGGWKDRLVCE
jgi:hypothetical protein